jgi:hypothetical protein
MLFLIQVGKNWLLLMINDIMSGNPAVENDQDQVPNGPISGEKRGQSTC